MIVAGRRRWLWFGYVFVQLLGSNVIVSLDIEYFDDWHVVGWLGLDGGGVGV